MKDFRELAVWQKGHLLALAIYDSTRHFPQSETYGLTGQLRRAAVSVGANIAEGCGRGSDADFRRFLTMAMGSASELEYLLIVAKDLSMLTEDCHEKLSTDAIEIKRMLAGLIKKLRAES